MDEQFIVLKGNIHTQDVGIHKEHLLSIIDWVTGTTYFQDRAHEVNALFEAGELIKRPVNTLSNDNRLPLPVLVDVGLNEQPTRFIESKTTRYELVERFFNALLDGTEVQCKANLFATNHKGERGRVWGEDFIKCLRTLGFNIHSVVNENNKIDVRDFFELDETKEIMR